MYVRDQDVGIWDEALGRIALLWFMFAWHRLIDILNL